MLKGPNFKAIENMNNNVSIDVIASGGVSSADDLQKLSELVGWNIVVRPL